MSRPSDTRQRPQWQPGRSSEATSAHSLSVAPTPVRTPSSGKQRASHQDAAPSTGQAAHAGARHSPHSYKLEPPDFRPYLHPFASGLETPDLYPPTLDQPEFSLDPHVTRDGLQSRSQIPSEAISVHGMIYERLSTPGVLSTLTSLLQNVMQARLPTQVGTSPGSTGIAAHSFRPPNRVTLNDLKLGNYIRQLADPTVPLHRLARSVPHGSKGERLLDMLWLGAPPPVQQNNAYASMSADALRIPSAAAAAAGANAGSNSGPGLNAPINIPTSVPIERAVWFIRVVGASELQSARNRATNYTAEFTSTVAVWLQKHLQELAVPLEPARAHIATVPGSRAAPLHTTSPANPGVTGSLSSPTMAGITSPSSGPSSPVQGRNFAQSPFSRSPFWHAGSSLTASELPAPASSQAHGRVPARTLLQPALLPRWISKWNYALTLIRALLYQQLLDARTLFTSVAEMMKTADFAQAAVLLFFIEEALEDMIRPGPAIRTGIVIDRPESRSWWPPFVAILCDRLHSFGQQLATSGSTAASSRDVIKRLGSSSMAQKTDVDESHWSLHWFVCTRIREVIVRAFDLQPSLFLHVALWSNHSATLEALILPEDAESSLIPAVGRVSKDPLLQRRQDFAILRERCDRLLNGPAADPRDDVADSGPRKLRRMAEILDSCSAGTDYAIAFKNFFNIGGRSKSRTSLGHVAPETLYLHVKVLLTWACRTSAERAPQDQQGQDISDVSPLGDGCIDAHRPFVAVRFLAQLAGLQGPWFGKEARGVGKSQKSSTISSADLHILLMRWLSDVDEYQRAHSLASFGAAMHSQPESAQNPAPADHGLDVSLFFVRFDRMLTVFGELERLGIFSFSKFVQRLTARGLISRHMGPGDQEGASAAKHVDNSLFGRLLRSLPVVHLNEAQLKTRRMAIYGPRVTESREEALHRRALRELRSSFAWFLDTDEEGRVVRAHRQSMDAGPTALNDATSAAGLQGPDTNVQETNPDGDAEDDEEEMGALFSDEAESEYDIQMQARAPPTDKSHFLKCSRYTQARLLREVFKPRLDQATLTPFTFSTAQQFSQLCGSFLAASDYAGLAEIVRLTLQSSPHVGVLRAACNALAMHLPVWSAMDLQEELTTALIGNPAHDIVATLNSLAASNAFQGPSTSMMPSESRSARMFYLAQCAWACVRLGGLTMDRFHQSFQGTLIFDAHPDSFATGASDFRNYFEGVLSQKLYASKDSAAAFSHIEGDKCEEIANVLLAGSFRHLRTASVVDAARIVEHLAQFCQCRMMTLDQQVPSAAHQLWSTLNPEESADISALGQGRVSFRAHRRFVLDLVETGCISAQVALKYLLLPALKTFAQGTSFHNNIVGRTSLATVVSFLQRVLLARDESSQPPTHAHISQIDLERILLLQKRSIPLLAEVYTCLTRAGQLDLHSRASSDTDSAFAKACKATRKALDQDGLFRAAAASNPYAFISRCRDELGGVAAVEQQYVLSAVAALVGPMQVSTTHENAAPLAGTAHVFDVFTAHRCAAELALAYESAATSEAAGKRLPLLRSITSRHYSALCVQDSGRFADFAVSVAKTPLMLSGFLDAAFEHSRPASLDNDTALRTTTATIGRLLRSATSLIVPVQSGASSDRLLMWIEAQFQQANGAMTTDVAWTDRAIHLLSLLRQLLRTSTFWTTLARQRAAPLLKHLIDLALRATEPDVLLNDVLGTIDFVLHELPSDAQMRSAINTVINMPLDDNRGTDDESLTLPLSAEVENRLIQRLPISFPDPVGEGLLFGSSAKSVLAHGRFSVQPNKVWDQLEMILQPDGTRANTMSVGTPRIEKRAFIEPAPVPLDTYEQLVGPSLVWLDDVGSLSLADFGAKRTRDLVLVPADSAGPQSEQVSARPAYKVISPSMPFTERSYGDHVGGEPGAARDLQHGLVNPSSGRRARTTVVTKLSSMIPTRDEDALSDSHTLSDGGRDDDLSGTEDSTIHEGSLGPSTPAGGRRGLPEPEMSSQRGSQGGSHRKRKRSARSDEPVGMMRDDDDAASTSGLSDAPLASEGTPLAQTPTPTRKHAPGGPRRGRSIRSRAATLRK
ncbi:hypothetical protein V8E36_000543 [Tilletia maclaganii]